MFCSIYKPSLVYRIVLRYKIKLQVMWLCFIGCPPFLLIEMYDDDDECDDE